MYAARMLDKTEDRRGLAGVFGDSTEDGHMPNTEGIEAQEVDRGAHWRTAELDLNFA